MQAVRHHFGALALTLVVVGMGTSGTALAEKVYKWVDAEGVTHYGEKAPKGVTAAPLKVTDTTSSDAEDEIAKLEKARQASRAPKDEGKAPAPPAGIEEANNTACELHRKNLEALNSGRRIRVVDEKGKPRALGDEELKSQIEFAEGELKRCEKLQKLKAPASKAAPKY